MKDQLAVKRLGEALPRARSRKAAQSVFGNRAFLVAVDLALGVIAYLTAWVIRTSLPLPYTQDLIAPEQWVLVGDPWLVLVLTQVFFLYIFGLYDDLRLTRYREIVTFIFVVCLMQMISVTSLFYFSNEVFPRSVILVFDLVNFAFLSIWRIYVKTRLKSRVLRVLIVGQRPAAVGDIISEIEKSPWMGLKVVGLAVNRPLENGSSRYPILGDLEEIRDIIVRHDIEEIIFASEPSWKDRVLTSLSKLQVENSVQIAILPSVYELAIGKLRHINIHDTPLIQVQRNPNEPFERFMKRALDLSLSGVALLLLTPLLLILAVLIKILSPGPVFYLQERVGYGARSFPLIKFRTMIPDAEVNLGETYASVGDPRVTRIGRVLRRFRIDELPQLLNVLKGDMSFVGPRPERPLFVEKFESEIAGYGERHKVKPGITGLAQVRSYYHTAAENKLKYDLAYIYNYSFSLDLLILLETIKVVLIRRGS